MTQYFFHEILHGYHGYQPVELMIMIEMIEAWPGKKQHKNTTVSVGEVVY